MSKINFPKKQEQRLIPKHLLEYAEELQENHPDPSAEWGGSGGGSPIEAGTGIVITGTDTKTISVDTETIPTVAGLATVAFSGSYSDLSGKPDLSVYELKSEAFSGDYTDLTNKPTIPDAVSGTNDGTNWTSLTIGSDTYGLAGGGSTPTNMVTTDTNQTISGVKTFTGSYTRFESGQNYANITPFQIGVRSYGNVWTTINSDKIIQLDPDGNRKLEINTSQNSISITDYTDEPIETYTLTGTGSNKIAKLSDIPTLPTLATVATTGDYDDLTNKPFIPTVGNGTITIKKNNTTVDTFTTNQSTNKSINITVPTKTSDLTNDDGFITGITSSDVTTALGYTPGTSNFSGDYTDLTNKPDLSVYELAADAFSGDYTDLTNKPDLSIYAETSDLATVATTGAYSDLSGTPTIPTATSDLTNDSGYITSSALSGYATETWVGNQGYLTSVSWNDVSNKPTFATVATSGDYTDLTNKPTIPTIPTNVSSFTNDAGYITKSVNDLTNYTLSSALATVATSGSYNDLSNKPNTPTQTVVYDCGDSVGVQTNVTWSTDVFANFDYIHIYYRSTDGAICTYVIPTASRPASDVPCALCATQVTTAGVNYDKNDIWYLKSNGLGINHSARYNQIAINTSGQVTLEHNEFIYLLKIVGYKNAGYFSAVDWNDITGKPTIPDVYYKNGDTFALNSYANLNGYLTSAGKAIQFTVTTPKSLANITSITVDNLFAVIRGVGGYVNGSSYIDYANTTGYTVTTYKATDNMITIVVDATNAYSSGTNNTPISLAFNPSNNNALRLTFNT